MCCACSYRGSTGLDLPGPRAGSEQKSKTGLLVSHSQGHTARHRLPGGPFPSALQSQQPPTPLARFTVPAKLTSGGFCSSCLISAPVPPSSSPLDAFLDGCPPWLLCRDRDSRHAGMGAAAGGGGGGGTQGPGQASAEILFKTAAGEGLLGNIPSLGHRSSPSLNHHHFLPACVSRKPVPRRAQGLFVLLVSFCLSCSFTELWALKIRLLLRRLGEIEKWDPGLWCHI